MAGSLLLVQCLGWRSARLAWLFLCCVLFAMVCLPTWSSSEPTLPLPPKLTSSDYLNYKSDLILLANQRNAYRDSLTLALIEKRRIEQTLADATAKYEALLASVTQHSDDSTTSSAQLLQEIARLTQLLADSQSMVDALRASSESAESDFDLRLKAAAGTALGLERSRDAWRTGALVASGIGVTGWVAFVALVIVTAVSN